MVLVSSFVDVSPVADSSADPPRRGCLDAVVFTRLGFEIAWRYQKHRTQYSLGDLAICLDETPIGCYVELEGPPDQIDRTAAEMGFGIGDYMLHSYRELYVLEAHRRGIPEGDLLVGKTSDAPGQ